MPLVFSPIVLTSYASGCRTRLPGWIAAAQSDPGAPPLLKAVASAITRYRDRSGPYIELLDGGLVDNYGVSGFEIARLSADTPYDPLTARQAAKVRRLLFLVVGSGRGPSGDWARSVDGPITPEIVRAAADTAIDSSARASLTAFDQTMSEWREKLIGWRCESVRAAKLRGGASMELSRSEVFRRPHQLRTARQPARGGAWRHTDAVQAIARSSSDARCAGQEALRTSPTVQAFLASVSEKTLTGRLAGSLDHP